MRLHSTKLLLVLVILLLGGLGWIHSHRTRLHAQLTQNEHQKENLKQHIGRLDEQLQAKNRELAEAARAKRQFAESVREVCCQCCSCALQLPQFVEVPIPDDVVSLHRRLACSNKREQKGCKAATMNATIDFKRSRGTLNLFSTNWIRLGTNSTGRARCTRACKGRLRRCVHS